MFGLQFGNEITALEILAEFLRIKKKEEVEFTVYLVSLDLNMTLRCSLTVK